MNMPLFRTTTFTGAAACIAFVGAASAADPLPKSPEQNVLIIERAETPRGEVVKSEDGDHLARWRSEATASDGAKEIVEIIVAEDSEPHVVRNGERIQVKVMRDGEIVRVLDPDEREIAEYRLTNGGKVVFLKGPHGEAARLAPPPAPPRAMRRGGGPDEDGAAPGGRVRLGVTMGSVSAALAAQSGVEAREVFLITDVLDGYPADKAGLKRFDIVLKINGEKPATPDRLRELVFSDDPRDTITMEVLRAGEKRSIEVRLGDEARRDEMRTRDRERRRIVVERSEEEEEVAEERRRGLERSLRRHLEEAMRNVPRGLREGWDDVDIEVLKEYADRAGREMNEAMGRFELHFDEKKWDDLREQIMRRLDGVELDGEARAAVEEAMKSLDEVMKDVEEEVRIIIEGEMEEELPRIRFFGKNDGEGVFVMPPRAPRAPEAPRAPRDPRGLRMLTPDGDMKWFSLDSDKASETEELTARFDRLEERMERLEKLLERLVEERR